jgi:hypothetical protein
MLGRPCCDATRCRLLGTPFAPSFSWIITLQLLQLCGANSCCSSANWANGTFWNHSKCVSSQPCCDTYWGSATPNDCCTQCQATGIGDALCAVWEWSATDGGTCYVCTGEAAAYRGGMSGHITGCAHSTSSRSQSPRLTLRGNASTIINRSSPGSAGNIHGYEDGSVRHVGNSTHMLVSELYGNPIWVGMRLAHWQSTAADGAASWERVGVLTLDGSPMISTANCSDKLSHKAALWSPVAFYEDNFWFMSYVACESHTQPPPSPRPCSLAYYHRT